MAKESLKDKTDPPKPKEVTSVKRNAKEKQKQVFMYTFGIVMFVLFSFYLFTKKPHQRLTFKKPDNPIVVKAKDDALEHWTIQSGATLSDLQKKVRAQEQNGQDVQSEISSVHKALDKQAEQLSALRAMLSSEKTHNQAEISDIKSDVTKAISHLGQSQQQLPGVGVANAHSFTSGNNVYSRTRPRLKVYDAPEIQKSTKRKVSIETKSNPYYGWLPMGAFFKATMLNGIVAPTGTAGESNPVPILFKIESNAILPNDKFRYHLKGCFLMGMGYGSVSSNRVHVRTSRISCISQNGNKVISAELKGYIVDDDNKNDLRGVVKNRQTAKEIQAMFAGFAKGVGSMFGSAQGTSVLSPAGAGISLTTSQKLRAAGFNGVSSASDQLAQFFLNQAESIYPVIIVNGGRNVTVNITQGTQLRWLDRSKPKIVFQKDTDQRLDSPSNQTNQHSLQLKETA